MKVFLYSDDTIDLKLAALLSGLNATAKGDLTFRRGKERFHITGKSIRYAGSYGQLSKRFLKEAAKADLAICFTKIPYDNNYFFQSEDNLTIVSFYAWEQLTKLPLENGAVYFLASVLRFSLPLPPAHEKVTGCINDFLWDKTGIDSGMKSGSFCKACKRRINEYNLDPEEKQLLDVVTHVIGDLGTASRNEESIVDHWKRRKSVSVKMIKRSRKPKPSRKSEPIDRFDVFLCHNAKDKTEIRAIKDRLEAIGVRTWLDEEQIRPGLNWQIVLSKEITAIESAAVFVGRSGIGPWQRQEILSFLSEFLNRSCPVIPVILANAKRVPKLPIFLNQLAWVDFRQSTETAMSRLVWGITGHKPKGDVMSSGAVRKRRVNKRVKRRFTPTQLQRMAKLAGKSL